MANIQNELNNIKNAIYGKDVRNSIHNAIKQCYDDASVNNDNANMEVKLARGVHNTLNDRLSESDKKQKELSSQLEQKVTKNDGGVITNAMLSQEVKEAMTGGSVAVVGKNTILEDNIVDAQITPIKTSFIKRTENLFYKDTVTYGYRLDTDGNDYADDTYVVSDFIPVENDTYVIRFDSDDSVSTSRICCYDASKNFTSILIDSLTGEKEFILTEGYIRIPVKKDHIDNICCIKKSLYLGRFIQSGYIIDENIFATPKKDGVNNSSIIDCAVSASKTDFAVEWKSPNLLDKSKSTLGEILSGGKIDKYSASNYIPVSAGVSYVVSPRTRQYALYSDTKTRLSIVTEELQKPVIIPDVNGYLRINYYNEDENIQVEEGEISTPYKEYGASEIEIKNLKNIIPMQKDIENIQKDIENINNNFINTYTIKLKKSGNDYHIISSIGGDELKVTTNKYGSNNGSFNFTGTYLNDKLIHQCTDDITPIRTFTTVGANHGYTSAFIIPNSDKTVDDIGSVWTCGTYKYCLVSVNNYNLVFLSDYRIENGIALPNSSYPTGNLNHVTGALNTSEVSILTKTNIQLYPSINNVNVKYFLDNKEIVEDGEYFGNELNIVESYNILSYKELYDFATSNKGIAYDKNAKFNDIGGCVKININYNFKNAFNCIVSHSFEALEKVKIGNCGFVQSACMSYDDSVIKRYMPHVNIKNGYDFSKQTDITNYSTNLLFNSNDLIDNNIPPNRVVDWLYMNGEKTIGFAMGYIPDLVHSKNEYRKLLHTMWDLRSTKKIYPVALSGDTFEKGDYRTVFAYRCYLPKYDATLENVLTVGNSKYVFIDYHTNISKKIQIDNSIGKKIEIILSDNFELQNDIVDVNGISFKITNSRGYAILKIN